jgi:phosphoenolpyruvate-protein kinase (PTS system EI component)
MRKFDRYKAQFAFIHQHNIIYIEDLTSYKADVAAQITSFTDGRNKLYKERSVADEPARTALSEEIAEQTAALRGLRKDLRLCEQIQQNVAEIKTRIQTAREIEIQKSKEVLEHERRSRSRRSDSQGRDSDNRIRD